MPVTLAQFTQQQIDAQGLTVKQFATRAGLGLSHAYQILRGERPRAEGSTFDAVARGLNMTPAEMAVAMGRAAEGDPEEVEWLAIVRQIPDERRPAAKLMLRGLTVEPTQHRGKSRVDGAAKRLEQRRRELLTGSDQTLENDPKRRKGLVTQSSGSHVRELFNSALAVIGLNRDSLPAAGTA